MGCSRNSISDSDSSSVSSFPLATSRAAVAPDFFTFGSQFSTSFSSSISPVVELQNTLFPVQPRGGNLTERDIRNAGILPMSSNESATLSSSSSSTSPHPSGKLKEPRDLYSTATLLHPLKWPVECQVIPEKIRHVDYAPSKLEPFYTSTGKEPMPQPVGVEMGTVVYDYQPKLSVDYFCRATVGGSQDLDDIGGSSSEGGSTDTTTLKFESRFESGNLAKAIKVTNMYYELYLRPDLYTERHAQWFYFRIQNTRDNLQYRFSIVNFNKPDSLYRYGLKVLLYSEKEAQLNGVGWTRAGQNIAYFKNDISLDDNGPYYTLTFNLKFRHSNDTVYLAQCCPYTYSTLRTYLKSIEEDEFKSQLLTVRLLCRSLAGNNVHVLTVTSPPSSSSASSVSSGDSGNASQNSSTESEPLENSTTTIKKPVIVISARVHPGETQSSYMMKGIIDFLTSNCSQAKELRDRFIFKLIPMLNPDGVIVGNSRCCLLGQDLNRQYRTVLREAFPQIYHAKVMLRRLQEENGIFLYCDLHGHSRRHNVFIYGCENRRIPEKRLLEQVFPLMMHKNAADKFSFQNCKFKIQKNKEGTGRIFVWTLGVVNSYTLEISLGGSTMPSRQYTHFSTADYEACGRHFCETLLDYSDPSGLKETLRERILQKLIEEGSTADEPKNVQLSDYSSLSNSETDGEAEDDNSDGGDTGKSIANSEKKAVLQPSNSNSSSSSSSIQQASKYHLKRQVSIRKMLPHVQRNVKSASTMKKPATNTDNRSPLPVHRASVDFTRVILKQKKLEEPIILQPPLPASSSNTTGDSSEGAPVKDTKSEDYLSASYRRLTKFRRKSKRHSLGSLEPFGGHVSNHPTAKCTTILFDDPFKPPGKPPRQQKRSGHHGNSHDITYTNRKDCSTFTAETMGCNGEQMEWLSGTEDECDPYDRPAPTIKITNCCGDSEEDDNPEMHGVTRDLGHLKLSSSDSESNKGDVPAFTPFTPSFPVGRDFLHQTCYPGEKEKTASPNRSCGVSKISNSFSDNVMTSRSEGPSRRSSISYLMGGVAGGTIGSTATRGGGKLQATGSTIFTSNFGGDLGRRRVSWTGTLTVSVPNVPAGTLGFPRSPSLQQQAVHHQRKKSFRKSRSLNDTGNGNKTDDVTPNDSTSVLSPSSVSMDRIPGVVAPTGANGNSIVTCGSIDKPPKWRWSNVRRMPSSSSSVVVAVVSTESAVTGKVKKRAKLKRSKHK